jgi:hypothetical protein
MRFRLCSWLIGLVIIVSNAFVFHAYAAQPENRSGGLSATISSVSTSGRIVSLQFTIRNISPLRQYFYAVTGSDGSAALSSGAILSAYRTSGIKACGNNFNLCNSPNSLHSELRDYNNLTYIEPGDSTVTTIQYMIDGDAQSDQNDFLSLPLILAVRTGQPESATGVERPPGLPHVVRFNFPRVPLTN